MSPAASPPPVLCLYASQPAASGSTLQGLGLPAGIDVFEAPTSAGPNPAARALRACASKWPGRDIVLLDRLAVVPPGWWQRLTAAGGRAWPVLQPLDCGLPELDPWSGPADAPSIDALDACAHMLGEGDPIPFGCWSTRCSLWRAEVLQKHLAGLVDGELPPGLEAAVLDSLVIGPGPGSGQPPAGDPLLPPAAITVLRQRIEGLGGRVPVAAGRDDKPVVLHLLHGWGGGVRNFVHELMQAWGGAHHLALVANGDSERKQAAEAFALHDDLDAPALGDWPLSHPIAATALDSAEYRALLQRTLQRYRVSRVLVSSLIGHGIAALQTGLPTALVCHDYYPLWPQLHLDFGDPGLDLSGQALRDHDWSKESNFLFAERRGDYWFTLREAWVEALLEARVRLFSPSQGVRDNVLRIEPRLAALPWQVIPHGLPAWPGTIEPIQPPARDGLRVLVLGRINGAKGEALLDALLPLLDPRLELVLLGSGRAGMRFFARPRVHVRMDYRREDLPALLAQLAPDLALIPVTVAETYSYTLSELRSLGVPVLATRIGSLAERINNGEDGLLVEPTATAVAARLNGLLDDRAELEPLRRVRTPPSLREMAADYAKGFQAEIIRAPLLAIPAPDPLLASRYATAAARLARVRARLEDARTKLAGQQHEIVRRSEWADTLQEQLDERTDWATSLAQLVEQERHQVAALADQLAERSGWAQSLQQELGEVRLHAEALSERLENRTEWARSLEGELARTRAHASQLSSELEARTEWAINTDRELATARSQLSKLQGEFDQRTAWALSLEEELSKMNNDLHALRTLWQRDHDRLQETTDALEQAHNQLSATRAELDVAHASLASAVAHGDAMQHDRDLILASRSWRLTRPLRFANRLVHGFFARLRFRSQRTATAVQRTLRSLRTRGLRSTLGRIRQELRPAVLTEPLTVPGADAGLDPASIHLPTSGTPLASVIIPVYNHLEASLICLRSLAATHNDTAFEIIVVDDCSSDDTPEVLPRIAGLRYQRNPENLGFIGACNAGAANARGEFVIFLNNDTAVQAHWLDALINTFSEHRDVGLVGAKLVYPDGRLQEAGGIVFADGSGWNYGRLDDPHKPEYNFVREVDYCSGAAIALRTQTFRELGGFDPHYAPAYYEDTDLAMKIRQRGERVLYQPASVVVHYEGVSSGTDTSSGTKRYQVINQKKFLERWKEQLASHPDPRRTTPKDIAVARQHHARKQVLVIDATTPQPDQDSGSVRLCNIMGLLIEDGHAVTFFADNRAHVNGYTQSLQQMGVEVLWHPFLSDPVAWFEQYGQRFDLVFISRHYIIANYVALVRQHAPQALLAFDTVDLHYLREQRAAKLANDPDLAKTAARTREQELGLMRKADVTLVVSPVEKTLLARELPDVRVEVLSNVHEVFGRRRAFSERRDIMFVGGYQHPPNVDAATWFVHEILPAVRAEIPELVFHLIGSKAPAEVKALGKAPGVEFHGFVEDLEPFLDGCRLAVAPLRYGAGVKGKVNMSMSYGQPVVATAIAVEGMHAEPGRDVLVADDPDAFARQIIRAYRDEALWLQLSEHAISNVREHFSFDSARRALRGLLGEAIDGGRSPGS